MTHPSDLQLQAWFDGDPEGSPEMQSHVEGCAECQRHVEGWRALSRDVSLWAEGGVPYADLADTILAGIEGSKVVPIEQARGWRRRWVLGAMPFVCAAAAAFVFVMQSRVKLEHVGPRPSEVLRAAVEPVIAAVNAATAANPGQPVKFAAADPRGTEVLSVEAAGAHASTYTVLQVPTEHEGVTTSIVWIDEDTTDSDTPTVQ